MPKKEGKNITWNFQRGSARVFPSLGEVLINIFWAYTLFM